MKNKKIRGFFFVSLAIVAALFLSGCRYEASLRVKDANTKDIAVMLRDYVGLNGYNMTYANDVTGIYRIVLGQTTTRAVDTSETFTVYNSIGSADTKTLVGQSTTINTSNPTRQLTAALAVQMTQQGNDVYFTAQSSGDLDVGDSFNVFMQSLKNKGYNVEMVK